MSNENCSQWYESSRNELLKLLAESCALGLPDRHAEELVNITRKCQENAFEIALVGEFQGGKSTTFNALCDGRDISPRGLGGGGIKTSAAVISAQNIADGEKKEGLSEWAEIAFKTKREVALGLGDVLKRPLGKSEAFRKFNSKLSDEDFDAKISNPEGFVELLDLDDKKCRKILQDALNDLWKRWNDDKGSLSDDELDELRITTLQLRFWGTAEYSKMISQAILPIDKFQKLIAFPRDWNIRWMNGLNSKFDLNEVAFVFVRSVLVRIHSENLRRLGCRITDCPGLFANAYDTKVAKQTINNADAVWYLISGEKQIGQKDLEIIRTISDMGLLGKIEASCNLKGPHDQKIADIIPVTKAALSNAGCDIDVFPYNARLAFLAMQGDLLLNKETLFSELDRDNMLVDAKIKDKDSKPSLESMWAKMVRRVGGSIEVESVEEIDELNAESIAVVRKESFLDDILTRLENEIIPQKAKSILVSKGSERAVAALGAYEGELKATEDAAQLKEEEWREKVDEARSLLEKFIIAAKGDVQDSCIGEENRDAISRNMVDYIVKNALNDYFIANSADRMAKIFICKQADFYWTQARFNEDFAKACNPIFMENLKDTLVSSINAWSKKNNTHKDSYNKFLQKVESLLNRISGRWNDMGMDEYEMLVGIQRLSLDDVNCEYFSKELGNDVIDGLREFNKVGFLNHAWKFVKGFLTLPFAMIGGVFDLICYSKEVRAQVKEAKIREELAKIAEKIRPNLRKMVDDIKFRDKLSEAFSEKLVNSIKAMERQITSHIEKMKVDFEENRVAVAEENFKKSMQERKQIAQQNKATRVNKVEPLRKRLQAFEEKVLQKLPK